MKLELSRHIFEKYSNITFHESPYSGNRVTPCGRKDGQTDMTKLIVAFLNFAKAPKNKENILNPSTMKCRWPKFVTFQNS